MSKEVPGRRSDYRYETVLTTRWDDNDLYGHMNNAVHYRLFDTAVNAYLITHCNFVPSKSDIIGLVAESGCRYHSELQFPAPIIAALRVGRLGTSSVRYEIGLFGEGSDVAAAEGFFVHVFVNRTDRQPRPLSNILRQGLVSLAD